MPALSISPHTPVESITNNAETKACKELLNAGKTKFVDYEPIFAPRCSNTIGANGRYIELIMTATHKVHSFLIPMVRRGDPPTAVVARKPSDCRSSRQRASLSLTLACGFLCRLASNRRLNSMLLSKRNRWSCCRS